MQQGAGGLQAVDMGGATLQIEVPVSALGHGTHGEMLLAQGGHRGRGGRYDGQ